MSYLKDICIDCHDPWTLGHWWADVLGYQVRLHSDQDLLDLRAAGFDGPEKDPSIAIDDLDGRSPTIFFNEVSELKLAKNRVHIDIFGVPERLIEKGAKLVERLDRWTVMTDPEGNEFCVFKPMDQ